MSTQSLVWLHLIAVELPFRKREGQQEVVEISEAHSSGLRAPGPFFFLAVFWQQELHAAVTE